MSWRMDLQRAKKRLGPRERGFASWQIHHMDLAVWVRLLLIQCGCSDTLRTILFITYHSFTHHLCFYNSIPLYTRRYSSLRAYISTERKESGYCDPLSRTPNPPLSYNDNDSRANSSLIHWHNPHNMATIGLVQRSLCESDVQKLTLHLPLVAILTTIHCLLPFSNCIYRLWFLKFGTSVDGT